MGRRTSRRAAVIALGAALALVAAGCDSGDGRELDPPTLPLPAPATAESTLPAEPTQPPLLQLLTPWQDGAGIPARHTCDGADIAPAMTWSNVPPDAIELAITVTDLDAGGFAHWIMYAIPPTRTSLTEGDVPDNVLQWANTYGNQGWDGPCPPAGEDHRYQFTVHALNQQLEAADNASAAEVISILNLIAIDQSSVSGTFVRTG